MDIEVKVRMWPGGLRETTQAIGLHTIPENSAALVLSVTKV